MERFEFAIIAQEITEHWTLPADSLLKDCRVFCLSMFCVGERTHVCSLTPSTYVDDMKNMFVNRDGSPLTDAQVEELDAKFYEHESLDHSYIGYVNPDVISSNTRVGDIYWNEIDPADYEDSDEGREEKRRDAWQDAREELQANSAAYEPSLSGFIPDYIGEA
jgi:hypothetical protein